MLPFQMNADCNKCSTTIYLPNSGLSIHNCFRRYVPVIQYRADCSNRLSVCYTNAEDPPKHEQNSDNLKEIDYTDNKRLVTSLHICCLLSACKEINDNRVY